MGKLSVLSDGDLEVGFPDLSGHCKSTMELEIDPSGRSISIQQSYEGRHTLHIVRTFEIEKPGAGPSFIAQATSEGDVKSLRSMLEAFSKSCRMSVDMKTPKMMEIKTGGDAWTFTDASEIVQYIPVRSCYDSVAEVDGFLLLTDSDDVSRDLDPVGYAAVIPDDVEDDQASIIRCVDAKHLVEVIKGLIGPEKRMLARREKAKKIETAATPVEDPVPIAVATTVTALLNEAGKKTNTTQEEEEKDTNEMTPKEEENTPAPPKEVQERPTRRRRTKEEVLAAKLEEASALLQANGYCVEKYPEEEEDNPPLHVRVRLQAELLERASKTLLGLSQEIEAAAEESTGLDIDEAARQQLLALLQK